MRKTTKIWTALGVTLAAGSMTVDAGVVKVLPALRDVNVVLVDGEGGEGGEAGGDNAASTYAMGSTDPNAFNFDGKRQIVAYADLVQKTYADSKAGVDALSAAIDALLSEPSDKTLSDARAAWVAARPAYLRSEAFRFYDGPIESIEGDINAWPLNEAYLDYVEGKPDAGLINSTDTINGDIVAALNQKEDEADVTTGWHAIEFMLWGQDLSADGPGARPSSDFIAGKVNNDRRRAFLKAITTKLNADISGLEKQWRDGITDNYRSRFLALEQREALGRIVNGIAILAGYEFMSERLAVALDSGDQEDEQSCFSDTTKQDFVADLDGIKQVWHATDLDQLVASRNQDIARQVTASLKDVEAKVAALGDPWDKVLAAGKDSPERKTAESVVMALQSLAKALKAAGNSLGVLVLLPTD